METVREYPRWFMTEYERIVARYPSRRIIEPAFHPAVFAGAPAAFAAGSDHSATVAIPQKEIFVFFGFRYAAVNMEKLLQYPFRMRVSDPSRQEALIPSFVFAPSVCSTAAHWTPMFVPVEFPGGSVVRIDIRMSEALPGGQEYVPEIVLCGLSLKEPA